MNPRDLRIGERRSYLEKVRREEAADRAFAAVLLGCRRLDKVIAAGDRRLRALEAEQDRALEALIAQADAQPPARATDAEFFQAWASQRCEGGRHNFTRETLFAELRCSRCDMPPVAELAVKRHLDALAVAQGIPTTRELLRRRPEVSR